SFIRSACSRNVPTADCTSVSFCRVMSVSRHYTYLGSTQFKIAQVPPQSAWLYTRIGCSIAVTVPAAELVNLVVFVNRRVNVCLWGDKQSGGMWVSLSSPL